MLNHLKILNSQKLSCLVGLIGLKSFYDFVSLAQFRRTWLTVYLLFYSLLLFKNIQKTSICSKKNTQKELNNIAEIFIWKHITFLPPPTPFLKGRIKFWKDWVGGKFFNKICGESQNGIGFFHFNFNTISYDNSWHGV